MLKSTHEKLIKNTSNQNKKLLLQIENQAQTIREMADEIREMDQLIYNMSQRLSWEEMRPYFNQLQDKQLSRQRKESDRLADIITKELISVYKK